MIQARESLSAVSPRSFTYLRLDRGVRREERVALIFSRAQTLAQCAQRAGGRPAERRRGILERERFGPIGRCRGSGRGQVIVVVFFFCWLLGRDAGCDGSKR